MSNKSGLCLLAMPLMGDPNFYKSVVLMVHFDKDGAFGLVLNHQSHLDIGFFARNNEVEFLPEKELQPLYVGGPVDPQSGWVLHDLESVDEKQEILPGVFMSSSKESLAKILKHPTARVKFVIGYSGWSEGQLESEMAQGGWLTADLNDKQIFDYPAQQMWSRVLKDLNIDPYQISDAKGVH